MAEIRIESALIDNISCLILSGKLLEPAPLIFFVHGFASDKRQGVPLGVELANKGFICVSIDTVHRGERVRQEFDLASGPDFQPVYPEETGLDGFITMLKMVRQTDLDIQSLIEYFSTDSRIDPVRVGMVGYSMGGWATFYSAAYNPAIKAAVSIAGTPCSGERWADLLLECSTYPEWDLELEKVEQETLKRTAFIQEIDPYPILVEKFPVPLLMICGDVDTIAPKKYNLDLYQQILEKHHPDPERLMLSVYDDIGHQLDLNMAEETAAWLKHIFEHS